VNSQALSARILNIAAGAAICVAFGGWLLFLGWFVIGGEL